MPDGTYERCLRCVAMMGSLLLAGNPAQGADADGWRPAAPDSNATAYDWIQLESDEWLKGEFTVMYDDQVEFDSEELDLQSFDLEDVRQLRTASTVQVGLVDKQVVIGRLFIEGDVVRVVGAQERRFVRAEVLSITPGEPREINYWSGKIVMGLNARSGNTESVEFNGAASIMRRTVNNRILIDYTGNYDLTGELGDSSDRTVTANNHNVTANWDRFLTPRLFAKPVYLAWFKDPFLNISHRETFGVGAGYELIDTKRTSWRVSGGPAYQQTTFVSVAADEAGRERTPALVVGTILDVELSSRVDYFLDYNFQFVNEVSGDYVHRFVTGFETEITERLDLDVRVIWDHITNPREVEDGERPEQNDYRLVVGVSFDW